MPSQHVILKIINGRTQLPTRSFTRGEPVPQFSVGSRGDWIVSGPGIASFHVLLTFDGEHVFAASADPATAPVYLRGSPIGNTWHAVTPSTELRFGGASLVVAREASIAPPAGASPPRPPKPEHRDVPLPPVTVRHAAEAAKHTGPGNTQFFEDLQAQVGPGTASAPPPPAASAEAMMAAIAPTLARQPPVTFPMEPPSNAAAPPTPALPLTPASQAARLQSSASTSAAGVQSAAPPPLISAPAPLLPSAPAAGFPMESLPTAFAPQFPGDTPGHLPNLPLMNMPAANLPTLASDSSQGNQASATAWSAGRAMELPTHFAPPGSVALPPGAAPTAIAPTDDGAPLPLGLPFAVPLANAEGEPFSTVAADADAIRNFAAHLPPSPPDPPLPPDAGYPHPYMQGQTPMPSPNAGYPTSLEHQMPPPAYAAPRYSHNPRASRGQGGKWVLIVLLPLAFAVIVVALAFYVIAR
ncbi:MAG TPA: hypothetical protein VFU02_21305 [Polyangiaceae bacterium]|nr:hypothetical protein [Polyangiaceae bacterium]